MTNRPIPTCTEVLDLGVLGPSWDDVVATQPLPSPFLRSWWLDATATPRRRYLLVMIGDDLVGGAAFDRDEVLGVPRYRFAAQGVLCPDHLDLVARPEHQDDVVTAFRSWFDRPGNRMLDLDGLVGSSLVERAVSASGRPIEAAPWGALPPSGEAWFAQRSSSLRRSVRRSTKALAALGMAPRRVHPDDLDRAVDAFVELHTTRDDRGPLLARTATLRCALRAGTARGEAWVHVIDDHQTCAAMSISFVVAGRISLYQVARSTDPQHDGAGTALLAHVIAEAADHGLVEADLLRGSEGYKSSFVTSTRSLQRLRVGRGRRARALVTGIETASARRSKARSWLSERLSHGPSRH